jgi:PPOX class probable F420-dependent enzyme
MAYEMSDEQVRAFLSEGTRTGKLATTRRDGRPHVVPIWFVLDGDDLVFNTGAGTAKEQAMQRDPRVAVCVDDDRPPYAFVLVEGTAAITDDPDEKLHWATRIAARYMGDDLADRYGRRNSVPEERLVRVTPTRIVAEGGVSDF